MKSHSVACGLLLGVSFSAVPAAASQDLNIEAELALPGVKLLVVEFFATWCEPCMKAVPRWEALRSKYAKRGLRFVVVAVKDDEDLCTDVPWTPDRVICDTEGVLARRFGVSGLPAAFLWNWQGHLLARKTHVNKVEDRIDGWMREIPRVDVEVILESRRSGIGAVSLRRLIASELNVAGKLVVVASARERKRLRALARRSLSLSSDERMRCAIGKEVSANNLLQATVTRGAKQLRLGLLSAESHCRTRDVYATWDRENPGRTVTRAVTKLLSALRRPTPKMPVAVQVSRLTPPASAETDLDALIAQATAAERKQKEAEEAARKAREAAERARSEWLERLEGRWRKVDIVAKKRVLSKQVRIRALTEFLEAFPDDNPHADTARTYRASLEAGKEPGQAATSLEFRDDAQACANGQGPACGRVAQKQYDQNRRETALEAAKKGCGLENGLSCAWMAKMQYEGGQKSRALDSATRGCGLDDGPSCSWVARIQDEAGRRDLSIGAATKGCTLQNGVSCSWGAKGHYENGQTSRALDSATKGCRLNNGASCGWVARIQVESDRPDPALKAATKGCELDDGDSCSWGAKVSYDGGDKAAALTPAKKGCALDNGASCRWLARIQYEAGKKGPAFEAAKEGCRLRSGVSCSWLAKIQYERNQPKPALESAKKGCDFGGGPACGWVARIHYEAGFSTPAVSAAAKGCRLSDGDSCSWGARIHYEGGRKGPALKMATTGCGLESGASCSWLARIKHEDNQRGPALEAARKGCRLGDESSCNWVRFIKES